jgi:hypothetical protein
MILRSNDGPCSTQRDDPGDDGIRGERVNLVKVLLAAAPSIERPLDAKAQEPAARPIVGNDLGHQ